MVGRPSKYGYKLVRQTFAIPEPILESLKELASLRRTSLNEVVVDILSKEMPTLEVIDKKIEELERQLEELHDLRQRTIARMISLIPESHKTHIRDAVKRLFDLYRSDGLEPMLERFFEKYSEVNNLPCESVKEFGRMVLEELVERHEELG